jgi:hypothetical protein
VQLRRLPSAHKIRVQKHPLREGLRAQAEASDSWNKIAKNHPMSSYRFSEKIVLNQENDTSQSILAGSTVLAYQ